MWKCLKKPNTEPPYNPADPLPGIYPDKIVIQRDTCTPVFIAALFTIAKTRKQPKCPLTDDWIKKMRYIYTMEYYSAIKKNKIMPFAATWMDLGIITLNEVKEFSGGPVVKDTVLSLPWLGSLLWHGFDP